MKLKHYLIASPENHYQPWILGKTAMVCFCLGIWFLRAFLPSYLNTATAAPGLDSTDLMSRINAERTQRFLPALITNSKLSAAATIKSQDMLDRDYFAHVNPDGDYVWPVIEAQGYKPYKALGENLAIDFSSAEAVVSAWMNSPGHRANILNEKFEDQGMAAVYGEYDTGHDTYTITNLFGTLMKVASSTQPGPTPTPAPTPAPTPTPQPAPTPTPSETPTPSPTQSPTPVPNPTPVAEDSFPETPITETAPTPEDSSNTIPTTTETIPLAPAAGNFVGTTSSDANDLFSLKIVLGIFAAVYTFFLVADSIIIHRAKIDRENMPSSPHALMMLLVSLVNFFTIWI